MKRSGKVVGPSTAEVAHRHGDQAGEQQEQQQEEAQRKSSAEQPVRERVRRGGAARPAQPTRRREGSEETSKTSKSDRILMSSDLPGAQETFVDSGTSGEASLQLRWSNEGVRP